MFNFMQMLLIICKKIQGKKVPQTDKVTYMINS